MQVLHLLLAIFFVFTSFSPSFSHETTQKEHSDLHNYLHKSWSAADGLIQDTVNSIVRDHDGYLWLGTENGVVRFDGSQFKIFEKLNDIGEITSMYVSTAGTLWIGTYGNGVVSYHNKQFKSYSTSNGLSCDFIRVIAEDSMQNTWFGTAGKGVIRFKDNTFTSLTTADGLSHDNVSTLLPDGQGSMWVGTNCGLNVFINERIDSFTEKDGLPDNHITSLCIDNKGSLLVGTINGLAVLNTKIKERRFIPFEPLSGRFIHSILADRNGSLWIAADHGLYYAENTDRIRLYDSQWSRGVLPTVISLYEDREGTVWYGTDGNGFGNFYPSRFPFYSVTHGLSQPHITTVYQDDRQDIWIGTRGEGLNRFKDGTFSTYTTKNGLSANWITSVYGDKQGNLWIGTPVGLNLFKDGMFKIIAPDPGLTLSIRALYVDHAGILWIGTDGDGLYRYSLTDGTFRHYAEKQGLTNLFVSVVTGSGSGNLWVGTRKGLFIPVKPGRDGQFERFQGFTTKDGLSCDTISDIYAESDGTAWIAVSCGGLHRFQRGKFTAFKHQDQPFAKGVHRILEDNRRQLWLSTANGVLCVKKDELDRYSPNRTAGIDYYHVQERSLKTAVFTGGCQPAGWKISDGSLWLPTISGIIMVPEEKDIFKPDPHQKVHVEQVLVDGLHHDLQKANRFPVGTEKIEIYCRAPNFTAPETIKYKFRLEKHQYDFMGSLWPDGEDVQVSNCNKVEYKELPAGRYIFTVSVGGYGTSIGFDIPLPFVESVWFYLLLLIVGLVVAGVIFVFVKRWSKEQMLPIWTHEKKYKTFKLSNREAKKNLKQLLEVMERDKPFLSPELTMPELAEKVGISKEMLSQVINRELHLNFNAFLNRYRVEEAKRKLRDPRENQFVILKIALDVGFNSKSSFNAVFKKTTGMSPSEYRDKYQAK